LPELSRFDGNPGEYLDRLKSLVTASGRSLEYSPDIRPALGQCSADKIIVVPDLSPAEEFHVLTHELAHARLHFTARRADTTKCIRETEAEAVAFVVSQSIGLVTNSTSSDYVRLYSGNAETLAQSLAHIQQVSTDIVSALAPN
jgi:Zn-dependent peptidase ImmA (M78 family)